MKNFIANNNYANCVGYALSQCYDSGINILGMMDDECDEQGQLQTLKVLTAEYEQALEIVEDDSTLQWGISKELREAIRNATTLDELYKC